MPSLIIQSGIGQFEQAFGIVQSGIGQLETAYKKIPFKLSWTHYQILMRKTGCVRVDKERVIV